MRYRVVTPHLSNYPDPIVLAKGQPIDVGQRYEGPEAWEDWYFCTAQDTGTKGWVPKQLIRWSQEEAFAADNYDATEMNVEVRQVVCGDRILNGWVWCRRETDGAEGWLPLQNLRALE